MVSRAGWFVNGGAASIPLRGLGSFAACLWPPGIGSAHRHAREQEGESMTQELHKAARRFRGGHALTITAALALAVAMLVVLAPAAVGAAPSCAVSNTRDHKGYSSVQDAVNAAKAGDTLEIKGTCFGPTTLDKNLTLKGVVNKTFPDPPTISGRLTPNT